MSDLDSRVTNVEQVLQRLNYVLEGHLSACAGDNQYRQYSSSTVLPSTAPHDAVKPDLARAVGLEEPHDEDAATNGMAMTFVEEHTSAFFGGSSNINFTRLLLSAVNHIRNTARGETTVVDRQHDLNENNIARASLSYANPIAATPDAGPQAMTALPPSEEIESLFDVYFSTAGFVFPFVDEVLMRKTYEECKANGWTRVRRTFLGTLNMIFAMATSYDRDRIPSARQRQERSNVFFKRATELCGELSKQIISLEIVQYLLLVVLHCQGVQRSVQAWNIHGLVTRSAMALGLHSAQGKDRFDQQQLEYRRRTWLVIYCMDKVLSAAFGRPSTIPDEYMVDPPTVGELAMPSPDGSSAGTDIPGDFLAVSFHLYKVLGGSLKKQYGGNIDNAEPQQDDMVSLQQSGELRKQLRVWSANLPPYLRLYEATSKTLLENNQVNRFRVILTLRYHNINILVHRPLLGSTIRSLFGGDQHCVGNLSYLIQLAMGEAHECIRSAQSTVELVYAIITADHTGSNNLGMGYYTLYYGM